MVGLYGETGALATKDVRKREEELAPGLLRLTMAKNALVVLYKTSNVRFRNVLVGIK